MSPRVQSLEDFLHEHGVNIRALNHVVFYIRHKTAKCWLTLMNRVECSRIDHEASTETISYFTIEDV